MASTVHATLYTTRAHVFQINTETKNSWVPKGDSAIPISFVAAHGTISDPLNDSKKLKIIGTSNDGELALDCIISWDTVFNKRSQKFVQWPDHTGMVYGLGFNSENDLNEFIETFYELRQKVLTTSANVNPLASTRQQLIDWNGSQQQTHISSEINGRPANYNSATLGRATSMASQYSNTSSYPNAVKPINEHSANYAIGNGGPSDVGRYPPRSQSAVGLQTDKTSEPLSNSNGTLGTTGLASSDIEDSHSAHSEHQNVGQLKYENERLKQALEENSKNTSLWHNELTNLRTNNLKLTEALRESKAHVQQWEKELYSLRDENKVLKLRVMALESSNDSPKSDEYKVELQKYKHYVDDLQKKLREKDDTVDDLQRSLEQMEIKANEANQNGDPNSEIFNNDLRQKFDVVGAKLEAKTSELVGVQREIAVLINKLHHL